MPTEGATHIADFNVGLPEGSTDQVLIVDDHFNMMKEAIKRDLGGFAGSILVFGESTNVANVYPVSLTVSPATYEKGMILVMKALNANTGAVDVNIASLGAKNLKWRDGSEFASGDIATNAVIVAVYDGSDFIAISNIISASEVYADTVAAAAEAAASAASVPLVSPATLDNAVVQNTDGSLVDAGVPLATIVQGETSEVSLNAYFGAFTLSHTLGATPQFVNIMLVCVTPNNGYIAGDEISLSSLIGNSSSSDNNTRGAWTYRATSSAVIFFGAQRTANAGDTPLIPIKNPTAVAEYVSLQMDGTWNLKAYVLAVTGTVAAGT